MKARSMEVEVGAFEDAAATFARDQWTMLRCSHDGVARARVWRRRDSGLLLGRFHRADPASCAWGDSSRAGANGSRDGLSRRLSGGRIVPVGPGVVCISMTLPLVDWLADTGAALRPDQVLNRALRPLLGVLRGLGIDAFYPGRDLITVGGRAIAHASFTIMRDGVAVVEMHVAESPAFDGLPALLDAFDPNSIAGVDRGALAASTSLEESGTAALADAEWAAKFAEFASRSFACDANVSGSVVEAAPGGATTASAADGFAPSDHGVTLAHESAARDFLLTPGPLEKGALTAAAVSMLGVVECSARVRGDRLTGLRVTGDLIAPFHTLDDVAAECEGEPFRAANIRKALARAMARPRSFVLGLREIDELILRIA
ncbi:MAG: hypothetical protein ABR587_16090 [Candidatus Binatia bacterium]